MLRRPRSAFVDGGVSRRIDEGAAGGRLRTDGSGGPSRRGPRSPARPEDLKEGAWPGVSPLRVDPCAPGPTRPAIEAHGPSHLRPARVRAGRELGLGSGPNSKWARKRIYMYKFIDTLYIYIYIAVGKYSAPQH